jgi:AcrR family transcriptional regulator
MSARPGLRERKKRRTREALVGAALRLFEEKGYEETTVAEIAAAADVSPRTFFTYFPSKEDVLFADTEDRLGMARAALAERRPDDAPADLLLRTVRCIVESETVAVDLARTLGPVRMRLALANPALQGRALRRLFDAQRELASRLTAAFPGELDETRAAAMVGALVGALVGTVTLCLERGAEAAAVQDAMRTATDVAVHGIAG